MNKIFKFKTLTVAVLLLSELALGASQGTYLGFLGGYRYNNMAVPSETYNNRTFRATNGYQAGLALLIPIADSVALRFGALYSLRDLDFSSPLNNPTATGRARLAYVDLPAALQFTLSNYFYIWFGQVTAVKISDTCDLAGVAGSCNSATAAPSNLGSVLGFGWDIFNLGSNAKLSIEAQYEAGLNNIWPLYNTHSSNIISNVMLRFGM